MFWANAKPHITTLGQRELRDQERKQSAQTKASAPATGIAALLSEGSPLRLASHFGLTWFFGKLLVMKFYDLLKKKKRKCKSKNIFSYLLTRMLERLKLDSCENVSHSPRKG